MERLGKHLALTLLLMVIPSGCGEERETTSSPLPVILLISGNDTNQGFLFAANRFLNTVYRIDPETLETVKVGMNKPRILIVSPDGDQAAVANERGRSISLIDARTLKVQTIRTGRKPTDVRYSPDGAWLAVAHYEDNSVSLIQTATQAVTNIPVAGGPVSVAFDETSGVAAVACFDSEAVALIGVELKQVLALFHISYVSPIEAHVRPLVVSFGPTGSPGAQRLFVGLSGDDYQTEADPPFSLAILPIWAAGDELLLGDEMQLIRSGPNPYGLIWCRRGEMLLTINHSTVDRYPGSDADTVSVLAYENQGTSTLPEKPAPASRRLSLREAPAEVVTISPRLDFTHLPDGDPRFHYRQSGHWVEQHRSEVGRRPIAAALELDRELVAIAGRDSASVSLLDLREPQTIRTVPVPEQPCALAYASGGRLLVVVHETPLMPVTVIDVEKGESRTLIDSLAMNRWLE